jgi:Resolvase, N terminal domain
MLEGMSTLVGSDAKAGLRAGVYARLSETYDAAESVPTQLANGERHAERRGWVVAGRFKDDGYSAYKEIARDDFVRLNLVQVLPSAGAHG